MTWYNDQKDKVFDNKLALEMYCQDDVTVLRQASKTFRRESIGVFLESVTIASPCIKVLKPSTIGLIPDGWYRCNNNYSK